MLRLKIIENLLKVATKFRQIKLGEIRWKQLTMEVCFEIFIILIMLIEKVLTVTDYRGRGFTLYHTAVVHI